jgi:hypothetical protein
MALPGQTGMFLLKVAKIENDPREKLIRKYNCSASYARLEVQISSGTIVTFNRNRRVIIIYARPGLKR